MAKEEHDLDANFDFAKGRRMTAEEIMARRTKCSPRNQSAKRAAEIEEEIDTRLREAFKNRLTSR